ncbi:MAG: hypothetical protein EOO04_01455 [Chitinophagaceae bacterium]|nr:MAG: hypothetical protein EOO04_01455 [Chitinophagaceae bacterium]
MKSQTNDWKNRRAMVIVFFAMLAAVIAIEYSTQRQYKDLDHNVSSLYLDRLMPANYLLRINDQLYQKQRWQFDRAKGREVDIAMLARANDSISALKVMYEKTYLTPAEKVLWAGFITSLAGYDRAELQLRHSPSDTVQQEQLARFFDVSISTLAGLSELQAVEGDKIRRSSKSILSGNFLQHITEISLLFMIGLIAINWLLKPQAVVLPKTLSHSAN